MDPTTPDRPLSRRLWLLAARLAFGLAGVALAAFMYAERDEGYLVGGVSRLSLWGWIVEMCYRAFSP